MAEQKKWGNRVRGKLKLIEVVGIGSFADPDNGKLLLLLLLLLLQLLLLLLLNLLLGNGFIPPRAPPCSSSSSNTFLSSFSFFDAIKPPFLFLRIANKSGGISVRSHGKEKKEERELVEFLVQRGLFFYFFNSRVYQVSALISIFSLWLSFVCVVVDVSQSVSQSVRKAMGNKYSQP